MESSQLVACAEECSSSESGWTMYLASPMHDDDEAEVEDEEEDEDDATDDNNGDDNGDGGGGGDDGDSLASDASSGPPHGSLSNKNGAGGRVAPKQSDEGEEDKGVDGNRKLSGYPLKRAHRKKVEKKRDDDGATVSDLMADGAASLFRGSDKMLARIKSKRGSGEGDCNECLHMNIRVNRTCRTVCNPTSCA